MRTRRARIAKLADDHMVVGLVIVAAALAVLFLSYQSQSGLPWTPSHTITVQVPDAGQLPKNADIRIGGARVGQVLKIEAAPRAGAVPAHTDLEAKLNTDVTPLPADTTAEVRIGSVLGSKYLALVPGRSEETIPEGGTLPLAQTSSTVGVDEAFEIFGPNGRDSLRKAVTVLAEGLAGRGTDINETVGNLAAAAPGLQRVLETVVSGRADLAGFVRGARAATGALAVVSPSLDDFIGNGATTLGALDAAGNSLSESIAAFPPAAEATRRALGSANPVLADLAAISRDLRPAADVLPSATRGIDRVLRKATVSGPRTARLSRPLDRALDAVGDFAAEPSSTRALQLLGGDDLATFGASAFVGLGAILATVADAERYCGAASGWVERLRSISSDGDSAGNWLRMIPLFELAETFPAGQPAEHLHANPYPNANASECEAGNEGYLPGQVIGNVPGNQGKPRVSP